MVGNDYSKAWKADAGSHLLAKNGLSKTEYLYKGEVMMKFKELQAKCIIPYKHLFKFLQVRSFIAVVQNQKPTPPPLSHSGDSYLKSTCCHYNGQISLFYNLLVLAPLILLWIDWMPGKEDLQQNIS